MTKYDTNFLLFFFWALQFTRSLENKCFMRLECALDHNRNFVYFLDVLFNSVLESTFTAKENKCTIEFVCKFSARSHLWAHIKCQRHQEKRIFKFWTKFTETNHFGVDQRCCSFDFDIHFDSNAFVLCEFFFSLLSFCRSEIFVLFSHRKKITMTIIEIEKWKDVSLQSCIKPTHS